MIDKNELLFVVDENNLPSEPKPREEVHRTGLWHRTTHIWIYNLEKELLCQRRSLKKDSNPGKWESFFGGHVKQGENELEAALKELSEELGIYPKENDFLPFGVKKDEENHEFQTVYTFLWHGQINKLLLEKDEVEIVRFYPVKEVKNSFEKHDPAWTKIFYAREVLDWLIQQLTHLP